jgi:tetratricopeptide (TPR) repeat protein
MLADLHRGLPGASEAATEWASARAELMIGSAYMDEGRPREAETSCLAAVRRLEALENTVERAQGDVSGLRLERANALLSLAVNANVRMKDPERALAYFERAYELDQRDFMQVLLACYRARSGRDDEARAVLRTVRPAPALYYNLACTHAMLGEADLAIDFLQREFLENHTSSGSLERQKEWAREDPDLASLRDDPRFRRLVESHP